MESVLDFTKAVKKVKEIMEKEWQDKWDTAEAGYFTKEIIPSVKSKIMFTKERDISITMIRILLNNAAVADNLFKMGIAESPNCSCDQARGTVQHKILDCRKHDLERRVMDMCA